MSKYTSVRFNDEGLTLSGDRLVEFLRGASNAIIGLETIDEYVLQNLPELKVVSKYGVGIDAIDLDAMRRHGVRLGWTPGVNKRSVAELVIMFAVLLLRKVHVCSPDLKNGRWVQPVGRLLSNRVVGIVGCGHIGKEVAILLRGFGCKILANDILYFEQFYKEHQIDPVDLDELLQRSEIVTLHVPLNNSTRNMLNKARLSSMKQGSILINAARGGLVDEAALGQQLSSGRLAAAGFDVYSSEPPTGSDLIGLPNFFGTPHVGATTEEAILSMGRAAILALETASLP